MKRFFAILLIVAVIFAALPTIPVFAGAKPIYLTDPNFVFANDTSPKIAHVYMQNNPGFEDWSFECSEKELDFVSSYCQMKYDNYKASWTQLRAVDITLYADCTTEYFPRCRDCDLNINLNGHTWTTSESRPSFEVTNYKSITISNGTLTFTGAPDYPIYSYGGKVTISNVVFKDCICGSYGLICVESNGSLDAKAKINPTVADPSKGEIYQKYDEKEAKTNGALHLKNVRFENCKSSSYGACVYVDSDQTDPMTIDNCQFINCSSKYGGALYFNSDYNTYNFTNCEFSGCSASTDGGAIYCESEYSKLNFTNCNAYRCHADDCGGFMFFSGENTVFNGAGDASASTIGERSNVIGCYALDSGGAFYSSRNGSCSNNSEVRNFNMAYNTAGAATHSFDVVKSNNSNSWGGAVCLRGFDMKLCYCDLYSNYANWYGGAVYCGYSGTSIENCTFYENRCSDGYGNDIYLDSATQYVTGCTFYTNGNSVAGYDAAKWEHNFTTSTVKSHNPFSVREIEDGDYIIYTALDEKYSLNIDGGWGAYNMPGENVQLYENGDANVFTVTKDKEKGAYIIKSKVTGLVLDVAGGSQANGTNIQQWESNGSDAQRWVFEEADNGYYYIRWLDGKYMDADGMVNGKKPSNNVNIQSWSFTGDTNQLFKLVKVLGDKKTEISSDSTTGNGSKERPYKISNADQWRQFAIIVSLGETYSGKYFELTDDISISYIPVGNYNKGKAFKGHLDGKNHTVHYLDYSENWDRGLFSCCNSATIKNLHVTGKIYGTESLAGISAGADNTTFENCINDADIKSINATYVAGISAKTNGCKFIGCVNNGEIQCEKDFAGGIAAQTFGKSEFTDCRNNGSIYAKGLDVGGILGIAQNEIAVKKCANNAPVTAGNKTAAGIVGSCQQGANIISCVNNEKGVISAKQYAAGVLAWVASSSDDINIKNCANYGEIKDTVGECGGIAVNQKNDNMTVVNCFNATTKIPYIPNITAITNEIEEGDYIIASALDEKYAVDIKNGNNAKNIPGKSAHLWQNGDANVFTVTKDKNKNAYIIKSKVTGLVLDVSGASKDDGANIQQWESNGTDAQRWVFEPANNGYCYIRCLGGQYMDASGMVGGAKPTNGVNIQSWSYTGDTNQQFRLVRVNDIPEGDYVIYTARNEKLSLDIDGGKGSVNVSGRNLHLWENGDANVFTVTKDKNKNAYIIKSKVTGLVLDVFGGSKDDGTGIQQWESNGTNAQRWKFENAGNGYYYIHWLDGKYMDIWKGNASSGSLIVSNQFNGADSQKFKLVKVNGDKIEEGDYFIQSAVDEKFAVDIAGGTLAVNAGGANAHLWQNGDASVFNITKDKDKDAYIIKSRITGLPLDVAGGSKDNGANVQQWGDNGSDPQRWVFENTGNGCYYIRCLGGQYMDASGMTNGVKPTNGVNIQSWSFTGATNQQFKLVKVSNTTGAITSAKSKGTYTNCYYLSGGVGDDRAKALSLADCGETLKTNMNMYIAKNVTGKETADWSLWQINSATDIAMPDFENVYAKNIKGEGTAEKPFLISSSKGLKELARNIEYGIDYTGVYFRLTENFAYTGTPIGTQEKPFTGIFDGNGHSVTLYMGGQNYTALFGVLVNGTVKNLKVSGYVQGAGSTAAIVGSAYNAHIDNCLVTADVIGTDANVGGVVGLLNLSTVSNCRMEGTVKNSSWTSTGGIVGGVITDGKLINCVFTGKVTGDKAVGGLVGCVMYGDPMIVNCASGGATAEYSKGGGYEHGGIVGFINSEINTMTISNCFSNCAIGISKDSGIVVGNNQKADKVSTDHIYYKKATGCKTSNTLGTGKKLKDDSITMLRMLLDGSADTLTENTKDEDAKVIEVDGIKLTPWAKESSFLAPKSYVQVSSLVASVFSAQNLPILIVIVIGLVAGVVGVTVMYRKKKKKSSMIKQ